MTNYTDSGALFSPCKVYRYKLWRKWSDILTGFHNNGTCLFVMLNPSVANGYKDDPTIRKCVGMCKKWGFARLEVVNLFSYISTDPHQLMLAHAVSPDRRETLVGPHNQEVIVSAVKRADRVVCAWGTWGTYLNQDQEIFKLLKENSSDLLCLGVNENGTPSHPLFLPYSTPLIPYFGRV